MISKLVDSVNKMRTWTFMNIKGQCHSLTFVQGHSDSISKLLCSDTARPIEAKFYIEPPWDVGNENLFRCSRSHAHIWWKTSKLFFLAEPRGRWPWNLVYSIGYSSTTYVFIWWPWVDLDHFYDRVKFVPECSACVKAYTALSANVVSPSLF